MSFASSSSSVDRSSASESAVRPLVDSHLTSSPQYRFNSTFFSLETSGVSPTIVSFPSSPSPASSSSSSVPSATASPAHSTPPFSHSKMTENPNFNLHPGIMMTQALLSSSSSPSLIQPQPHSHSHSNASSNTSSTSTSPSSSASHSHQSPQPIATPVLPITNTNTNTNTNTAGAAAAAATAADTQSSVFSYQQQQQPGALPNVNQPATSSTGQVSNAGAWNASGSPTQQLSVQLPMPPLPVSLPLPLHLQSMAAAVNSQSLPIPTLASSSGSSSSSSSAPFMSSPISAFGPLLMPQQQQQQQQQAQAQQQLHQNPSWPSPHNSSPTTTPPTPSSTIVSTVSTAALTNIPHQQLQQQQQQQQQGQQTQFSQHIQYQQATLHHGRIQSQSQPSVPSVPFSFSSVSGSNPTQQPSFFQSNQSLINSNPNSSSSTPAASATFASSLQPFQNPSYHGQQQALQQQQQQQQQQQHQAGSNVYYFQSNPQFSPSTVLTSSPLLMNQAQSYQAQHSPVTQQQHSHSQQFQQQAAVILHSIQPNSQSNSVAATPLDLASVMLHSTNSTSASTSTSTPANATAALATSSPAVATASPGSSLSYSSFPGGAGISAGFSHGIPTFSQSSSPLISFDSSPRYVNFILQLQQIYLQLIRSSQESSLFSSTLTSLLALIREEITHFYSNLGSQPENLQAFPLQLQHQQQQQQHQHQQMQQQQQQELPAEEAAAGTSTATLSPLSSYYSSAPSTPALPTAVKPSRLISQFNKKPLKIYIIYMEQQLIRQKKQVEKMTQEEREKKVPLRVRLMGAPVEGSIYFVAKDMCQLIHTRKGNVAKSVSQFTELQKARMPVLCPRSNATVSTHTLTVLSVEGIKRLFTSSRSPHAPILLSFFLTQKQELIQAGAQPDMESRIRQTIAVVLEGKKLSRERALSEHESLELMYEQEEGDVEGEVEAGSGTAAEEEDEAASPLMLTASALKHERDEESAGSESDGHQSVSSTRKVGENITSHRKKRFKIERHAQPNQSP